MGIFDALTTAVAGLQAQSFALQNISGNIANSQTTAYKETDTSFQDLVSQAVVSQQTTNGIIANSVATKAVQGTIQSTSVSTDMAINGDGWFVVSKPTGLTDNLPVFSGVNDFTCAGDFQLDSGGFLVNSAGYYLMGIPTDPTTGNPTGSVPQVLQFNNSFIPAQATTQIQYQANLPSTPAALLNQANFQSNPLAGAQILGSGASLLPDAIATGTGTVGALTGSTLLTNTDTYSVNDGTNTTSFTAGATSTIADLMNATQRAPRWSAANWCSPAPRRRHRSRWAALAQPRSGSAAALTFDSESIDGGSITSYDADGNPTVNVDFRWAKISSAVNGGTDAWQLFYQTNSSATGTQTEWQNVGTTFTFNSSGQLTPAELSSAASAVRSRDRAARQPARRYSR